MLFCQRSKLGKMLKSTTTLLFVLLWYAVSAQPGFNRVYDPNPGSTAFINLENDTDTTFVVYGGTFNNVPPFQQGIWVARLDTFGNILQTGSYFDPERGIGLGSSYRLLKTLSGGFVGLGGFFDLDQTTFLIKFDQNLQCVGIKEYNNAGFEYADLVHLAHRQNGGYFISGGKIDINHDNIPVLMAVDTSGNILWQKTYGDAAHVEGISSIIPLAESTGAILSMPSWNHTTNNHTEPFAFSTLMTINKIGTVNEYWRSDTLEEGGAASVRRTENGDFLYLTRKWVPETETLFDGHNFLVCRDSLFQLKWKKQLTQYPSIFNAAPTLNIAPDGSLYIVGDMLMNASTSPPDSFYMHDYIYKLTATGDSLWQQHLFINWGEPVSQNIVTSEAIILPSGSHITGGAVNRFLPDGARTYGWIIKHNADGCIDWSTCISDTEIVPQPNIAINPITINPNPTQNETWVTLNHAPSSSGQWALYDITGKVVLSDKWPQQEQSAQIMVGGLPAGIYFFAVQWNDGLVQSSKIVIYR